MDDRLKDQGQTYCNCPPTECHGKGINECRWELMRTSGLMQQPAAQPVAFDLNAAVDRFLGWPLPQDFAPDGGITFDRKVRTAEGEKDRAEMRPAWWPVGTNLLTADQARAMLAHVLGLSAEQQPAAQPELSMSMFATKADYEAAVKAQPAHIPVTAEEEASIDLALGMHALPTIRLPLDAYKRLADEAAARSVTLSAFVRWLLSTPQPEPASAELVATVHWSDIGHITWRTDVVLPDGTKLYTHPIDTAEVLRLAQDLADAEHEYALHGVGYYEQSNPLGMAAEVAEKRAALCRALWVKE